MPFLFHVFQFFIKSGIRLPPPTVSAGAGSHPYQSTMTGGYAQQTSTPEGGMQTQPPQPGDHFTTLVHNCFGEAEYNCSLWKLFLHLYASESVDKVP